MSDLGIREQVESYINQLSEEKLLVAADSLSYLVEREDNEATEELLNIVGFENDLKEAEEQAATEDLVSFKAIRRNV
ncbi:hypothetical protein [Crocosphaera sp.]|uniref:hypothetical protein n=1 Tax=Crocosphaera sp. TaxID=2729996 RepID=UPI0026049480|nr:hypothetical protein [Crocosphaera sp.]MDJ0579165.1 hypothetical protein [Crocosphaera sp.]